MDRTQQARVAQTTAIVMLIVGLSLLTVKFAFVFLLIFGAILIATLIRAAGLPFRKLGVWDSVSVILGIVVILAILGLSGWLFGSSLADEFVNVANQLPAAYESARAWLEGVPFIDSLGEATPNWQSIMGQAVSFAFGAVGAIANIVLVTIAAIYLALNPKLYARGITLLFPKRQSERVGRALDAAGGALHRYLLGQMVNMVVVGTLTWIGLMLIGAPSAGALGVIAGLTNFIPLVGPFIGAVPGVLLAFAQDPALGLWAVLVYVLVQQAESDVLTPIVQRYAVTIPPAVLLFAFLALGGLFGILGVILSAPLAVVIYVLVNLLWVDEALRHNVDMGEIEEMTDKGE